MAAFVIERSALIRSISVHPRELLVLPLKAYARGHVWRSSHKLKSEYTRNHSTLVYAVSGLFSLAGCSADLDSAAAA
jgi:hypothetical protein